MESVTIFRLQARANRLANRRLHAALAGLTRAEFVAPRTGFFPSLAATLSHLLAVDEYYIGALHGESELPQRFERFAAADDASSLAARQRASDERLIAFCDALDAARCDAVVAMDRGNGKIQRDLAGHVLSHLFMHQTHHRGQAHAMLSGTTVPPPQLDEFLMPSDASWRAADMAALGWREIDVYGGVA
ncbi:MAG: DinB family protein [Burkholderiales bacterium]